MRRLKVGLGLVVVAGAVAYAGRLVEPEAAEGLLTVRSGCYLAGGWIAALAAGLVVFGRINLLSWFVIDLRGASPRVSIGPPAFRVAVGTQPRKGALRIPGTGLLMTIPLALRLAIKAAIAYVPAHFLQPRVDWLYAGAAGVGTFVLLWILERRLLTKLAPTGEAESTPEQRSAEQE